MTFIVCASEVFSAEPGKLFQKKMVNLDTIVIENSSANPGIALKICDKLTYYNDDCVDNTDNKEAYMKIDINNKTLMDSEIPPSWEAAIMNSYEGFSQRFMCCYKAPAVVSYITEVSERLYL